IAQRSPSNSIAWASPHASSYRRFSSFCCDLVIFSNSLVVIYDEPVQKASESSRKGGKNVSNDFRKPAGPESAEITRVRRSAGRGERTQVHRRDRRLHEAERQHFRHAPDAREVQPVHSATDRGRECRL